METLKISYRGHTIEPDYRNPYSSKPEYMYYPTEEGPDHDYDLVGEDYKYCGNCGWADSIEEAKDAIMEKIMEAKPYHVVKTTFGMLEYCFPWLSEATGFQKTWGGELLPYGQPIYNP